MGINHHRTTLTGTLPATSVPPAHHHAALRPTIDNPKHSPPTPLTTPKKQKTRKNSDFLPLISACRAKNSHHKRLIMRKFPITAHHQHKTPNTRKTKTKTLPRPRQQHERVIINI
ncbi:MAG: hypothetical protein Q4D61_02880 [Cardiobacteriaceae bacterium]|nr:hypothetical protein [Cardiobacteriaceae bacterium]